MEVQDDVLNSFTNKYLKGEELRIFNRIKQLVELYGEGRTGNQGGGGDGINIIQVLKELEKEIIDSKTKANVKGFIDGMSEENSKLKKYKEELRNLMGNVNKRTIKKAKGTTENRTEIIEVLRKNKY